MKREWGILSKMNIFEVETDSHAASASHPNTNHLELVGEVNKMQIFGTYYRGVGSLFPFRPVLSLL